MNKNIIIIIIKIAVSLIFVFGFIYFGFYLYNRIQSSEKLYEDLIGQKQKYQQLSDYVAKLEIQYKEQKDLIKEKDIKFREITIEKDNKIRMLGDATFLIKNRVEIDDRSDIAYESSNTNNSYIFNEIRLYGKDSPPIGWIMIKNNGEIISGNYKFEIVVDMMQTENEENGKFNIYSKAYFVAKQNGIANRKDKNLKKWEDIKYELPIVGGSFIVDPTRNKKEEGFNVWNPKFSLGVNGGIQEGDFFVKPSLSFSFLSYGDKNSPKFKFISVGIGLWTNFDDFDVHSKPISYAPFKLINNTYIYPFLGINIKKQFNFGSGLELNF